MVFNVLKVQHPFCICSAWTSLNFSGRKWKVPLKKLVGLVDWRHWCILPPLVGLGKCSGELWGVLGTQCENFCDYLLWQWYLFTFKNKVSKECMAKGEFSALYQAVVPADVEWWCLSLASRIKLSISQIGPFDNSPIPISKPYQGHSIHQWGARGREPWVGVGHRCSCLCPPMLTACPLPASVARYLKWPDNPCFSAMNHSKYE